PRLSFPLASALAWESAARSSAATRSRRYARSLSGGVAASARPANAPSTEPDRTTPPPTAPRRRAGARPKPVEPIGLLLGWVLLHCQAIHRRQPRATPFTQGLSPDLPMNSPD